MVQVMLHLLSSVVLSNKWPSKFYFFQGGQNDEIRIKYFGSVLSYLQFDLRMQHTLLMLFFCFTSLIYKLLDTLL